MSLEVGQVLGGKYMIERVIGRGSMGFVYKGHDIKAGNSVAIRLILPEFDNDRVPAFFESEAKLVGDLNSDNIARLYNMGFLPTGERCLVGEFVDGEVLQRRIRSVGHLPELAVAQLLIQLLESLSAAHEAGVVHRDLTPLSIFVVPRNGAPDGVKLIDFGISRLQLLTANPDSPPAAIVSQVQSFQYLSPEQLNGLREIDPRSNIYALGVIAYEAITGRLPFEGKDFGDLTFNILQGDPPPVEEVAPESSSPFSQLVSKAMARSPNARFQYAEEMYAAISNWAIRAGISKSKLESGISDWRSPEVPVLGERPATRSSPAADSAPEVAASVPSVASASAITVPENETLPWGSVAEQSKAPEAHDVSAQSEPSYRAKESSGIDYFAQPSSSLAGLAEEDALFAPPPTAPRDELPIVSLEGLAPNAAVVSEEHATEEHAPPAVAEIPRVEPGTVDTSPAPSEEHATEEHAPPVAAEMPRVEPGTVDAPAHCEPASPSEVAVEPKPILASPATTEDEQASSDAQDPSLRRARTILGLGGVALRPALKSDPNAGVVVRAPESVESDVPPSVPSSVPAAAPYRPRQATVPGITPPPFETAPVPITAPAFAESARAPEVDPAAHAEPPSAPTQAEPREVPAQARVAAQKPEPVSPTPQQTPAAKPTAGAPVASTATKSAPSPAKPATPIAAAASSVLSDIEIPVEFRRGRTKKPLVVAILLVGLAVAGAAVALLQKSPPPKPVTPLQTPSATVVPSGVVSPEIASPAVPPPASSGTESAAGAGAKPSPSLAEAASAARKATPGPSQSGASLASSVRASNTSATKSQKPAKPVQPAQSATPGVPAKPTVSKGAVSKDPYNYR